MNANTVGPSMSQKIFSMDLSVEAVSLYLLCCAVADTGSGITKETLAEKWNSSRAALERELRRLEEKNILGRDGTENNAIYQILDVKKWL